MIVNCNKKELFEWNTYIVPFIKLSFRIQNKFDELFIQLWWRKDVVPCLTAVESTESCVERLSSPNGDYGSALCVWHWVYTQRSKTEPLESRGQSKWNKLLWYRFPHKLINWELEEEKKLEEIRKKSKWKKLFIERDFSLENWMNGIVGAGAVRFKRNRTNSVVFSCTYFFAEHLRETGKLENVDKENISPEIIRYSWLVPKDYFWQFSHSHNELIRQKRGALRVAPINSVH